MNQDKYNEIKTNFNNFLANRASRVEEQMGNMAFGQEETVSNTPKLSPEQVTAVAKSVAEWWQIDRVSDHGELDEENNESLLNELRQILSKRGKPQPATGELSADQVQAIANTGDPRLSMREVTKAPKKDNGKFSKKEIDAYKADHETGKKDSKGKPVYNQNWKKK